MKCACGFAEVGERGHGVETCGPVMCRCGTVDLGVASTVDNESLVPGHDFHACRRPGTVPASMAGITELEWWRREAEEEVEEELRRPVVVGNTGRPLFSGDRR